MSFLLAPVLSFKTSGVQWGSREGDWKVFGEGLHRWQGQVEAKEAGLSEKQHIGENAFLTLFHIFPAMTFQKKTFPRWGRVMPYLVETQVQARIVFGTGRLSVTATWSKTSSDGGSA